MGTRKSGRTLNKKGSPTIMSEYAVVHSNDGDLIDSLYVGENWKKISRKRLKAGGHGQDGMDLLDKCHIKYEVTKTWENGVRIGNVDNHPDLSKRQNSGQSWFPKNWDQKKIKEAAEYVASLKANLGVADGQRMIGIVDGVKVVVIKTNGQIATAFPDKDQSDVLERNDK